MGEQVGGPLHKGTWLVGRKGLKSRQHLAARQAARSFQRGCLFLIPQDTLCSSTGNLGRQKEEEGRAGGNLGVKLDSNPCPTPY